MATMQLQRFRSGTMFTSIHEDLSAILLSPPALAALEMPDAAETITVNDMLNEDQHVTPACLKSQQPRMRSAPRAGRLCFEG
jgi:hypothetical protein